MFCGCGRGDGDGAVPNCGCGRALVHCYPLASRLWALVHFACLLLLLFFLFLMSQLLVCLLSICDLHQECNLLFGWVACVLLFICVLHQSSILHRCSGLTLSLCCFWFVIFEDGISWC